MKKKNHEKVFRINRNKQKKKQKRKKGLHKSHIGRENEEYYMVQKYII